MSLFASFFFFFNDTATTEIYTLSLHDALPISVGRPFATSWAIEARQLRPLVLVGVSIASSLFHPSGVLAAAHSAASAPLYFGMLKPRAWPTRAHSAPRWIVIARPTS